MIAQLKATGFTLLDTQFVTDHLRTFGAIEVSRRHYHKLLEGSLIGEADFAAFSRDNGMAGKVELQWDKPWEWNFVESYQLYTFFDAGKVWNDVANRGTRSP